MTPTEQNDTKELRTHAEKAQAEVWPFSVNSFRNMIEPATVIALLDRLERAEAGRDELTCDDIERLRLALSWVGYATPEGLEECGIRHVRLTRDLINGVLSHKERTIEARRAEAAAGAVPDGLREAMVELMNSDQNIAGATDDELREAANNPDCDPVVRVQAKAVLKARAALTAAPSAPVAAPREPVALRHAIEQLAHDPAEFGRRGKVRGFEKSRRSGWNAALSHVLRIIDGLATPPAPMQEAGKDALVLLPREEWHEDYGQCLFFHFDSFEECPDVCCDSPLTVQPPFDHEYWTHFVRFDFNEVVKQAEARAIATSKEEA